MGAGREHERGAPRRGGGGDLALPDPIRPGERRSLAGGPRGTDPGCSADPGPRNHAPTDGVRDAARARIPAHRIGCGNHALLGRYTLWWDDYAPLSTRRAALLAGLKFPTGADRFGTETFDPILGGAATWAFDRHEIDLDALYTVSTERNGFRQGDRIRYDAAYRYRIWPQRFGRQLLQFNGLIELNGRWSDFDRHHGRSVVDSGGHVLFLAPGVQLAAKSWILEASIQVPIAQDLHGSQINQDFVAVLSVRIPFALPF